MTVRNNINTFGSRLKELIDNQNLNVFKFTKLVDISNTVIHKAVNGEHKLSMDNLEKISRKTNVNLHWLITGEENMYNQNNEDTETQKPSFEHNTCIITRKEMPKFIQYGSAIINDRFYWPFSQTKDCIMIEVTDNSLEPIFKRSDYVVAETASLDQITMELYVIITLHQVLVRYLKQLNNESFKLSAPNIGYPSDEITKSSIKEVYMVTSKFSHNLEYFV
jgi:phage repressor protein C with HTH and peptisase S24 domain